MIRVYANRLVPSFMLEDAMQEARIELWQAMQGFKTDHDSGAPPWGYADQVLRNYLRTYPYKKGKWSLITVTGYSSDLGDEAIPPVYMPTSDQKPWMEAAKLLPEPYCSILLYRYEMGYKQVEIRSLLGLTRDQVKYYEMRGLKALRFMDREQGIPVGTPHIIPEKKKRPAENSDAEKRREALRQRKARYRARHPEKYAAEKALLSEKRRIRKRLQQEGQ